MFASGERMKTRHPQANRRRQRNQSPAPASTEAPPQSPEREPPGGRVHGDSYSDLDSRDDALAATTSTHGPRADRRPEEPSESLLGSRERLEGDV